MNNRENDGGPERVRARAGRDGVRQNGGSYQRPAQSVRERRSTRQSYGGRDEYDEEHHYSEEYGVEGNRQVGSSMEGYLNDEPPVPSRRLRSSHGSSDSIRRCQAQSTGNRQIQSGKSRQAGNVASNPDRTRAAQTVSRNQRRAGYRRQDTMKRGRASVGRQQEQMTKRRKKGRWKGLLLLLLAIFIGYGAWMFLHRPTGYWNIAVFGVSSKGGNTKNVLADIQMICSIDRSAREIRPISVYRDIYLKVNSEGAYHKVNEACFRGGHKQAVSALEENLNIKIDDYATFNWESVVEATNILGGINLEITPAEFKYINGFITETVNSTGIGPYQLEQAGMNHLDGVQAVAYSRLRLMDTDFQRTEHQGKIVELALAKTKQTDVSTLTSLAAYMVQEISISVRVGDVLPLSKDTGKYHIGETIDFPFSRQTKKIGKMGCVMPTTLENNVVLLHQFLYGGEISYNPSSSVREIGAHMPEETGLYEEDKAAPFRDDSSGSSSSDGRTSARNVPAGTPPPETAAPEETTPGSTEETEKTTQESAVETGEIEKVGPGVSDKPIKAPESTKNPDEEQGLGTNGPGDSGAGEPSANHPIKTPETEKPDPGLGSSSDGTSQGPRSQGNGPGQAQSGTDESDPGM